MRGIAPERLKHSHKQVLDRAIGIVAMRGIAPERLKQCSTEHRGGLFPGVAMRGIAPERLKQLRTIANNPNTTPRCPERVGPLPIDRTATLPRSQSSTCSQRGV